MLPSATVRSCRRHCATPGLGASASRGDAVKRGSSVKFGLWDVPGTADVETHACRLAATHCRVDKSMCKCVDDSSGWGFASFEPGETELQNQFHSIASYPLNILTPASKVCDGDNSRYENAYYDA